MIASSLPDSRGKTFFPCRKHNKHGAGHAPPGRWLLASIPWEGHLWPLLLEDAAPPGLQDQRCGAAGSCPHLDPTPWSPPSLCAQAELDLWARVWFGSRNWGMKKGNVCTGGCPVPSQSPDLLGRAAVGGCGAVLVLCAGRGCFGNGPRHW